ncbi:MAG: gluconate 2-dehydrogenase subunit 3 family protein [Longimicrobiaceae bacterium]
MQMSTDVISRREALRRTAWLLGGAISAPTLVGVLAGCGRDRAPDAAWTPRAFTPEQNEMVVVISDHIIPETDTPGARAVRVNEFIDEMLAAYYPEEERNLFLAGLNGVDDRARQAHGQRFVECAPEQQLAILTQLDQEAFAPRSAPTPTPAEPPQVDPRLRLDEGGSPLPPGADRDSIRWIHGDVRRQRRAELPFFRTMKELTIVGYYTSEVGATQELRHEPTPGRYEGCVPFNEIGRAGAV